jgi:hypothetical protein
MQELCGDPVLLGSSVPEFNRRLRGFHRFLLSPGLQNQTKIPKIGVIGGYLLLRSSADSCVHVRVRGNPVLSGSSAPEFNRRLRGFYRFLLSPGLQTKTQIPRIGVIGGYYLLRTTADSCVHVRVCGNPVLLGSSAPEFNRRLRGFHRFLLSPGLQTKTQIPKIGVIGGLIIATEHRRFVRACRSCSEIRYF